MSRDPFRFIPDREMYTPEQWARVLRVNLHEMPAHKRIALSMLHAAWEDAITTSKSREVRINRQSAIDWIRGHPPGRLPMIRCCETLGIDHVWFREGFLRRLRTLHLQPKPRKVKLLAVLSTPHHPSQSSGGVKPPAAGGLLPLPR